MNTTINRLKLVFLGLFAIGVVAIWTYQIFWVWPAKDCDGRQGWWDYETRTCAAPIYIPDLTGRPAGMSRKEWSEIQAAKKVDEERLGFEAKAAEKAPPAPEKAPPAAK